MKADFEPVSRRCPFNPRPPVVFHSPHLDSDGVEDGLHAEHRGQGGGGAQQDDRQEPAGRRGEGGPGGQAAAAGWGERGGRGGGGGAGGGGGDTEEEDNFSPAAVRAERTHGEEKPPSQAPCYCRLIDALSFNSASLAHTHTLSLSSRARSICQQPLTVNPPPKKNT